MSADFNNPTVDDQYTEILPQIRDNQTANAVMFNGVAVTNIPVNAVQFVSGQFNTWDGAAWNVQPVSITGGGTGGSTALAARSNLSLSSISEANALYLKAQSNGSDISDKSIFRTEINVYSKSETYTQSEVDAKTIINNTLTSTSTTESLAAAQGKVLKDNADALAVVVGNITNVGFYQEQVLGSSGALTGNCKVVRVGSMVTISGEFTHANQSLPSSNTNYLPSWAVPLYAGSFGVGNSYTPATSSDRRVAARSDRAIDFGYSSNRTSTGSFTISYTV